MREQKATIIDSMKPKIRILKEESGRIKASFTFDYSGENHERDKRTFGS